MTTIKTAETRPKWATLLAVGCFLGGFGALITGIGLMIGYYGLGFTAVGGGLLTLGIASGLFGGYGYFISRQT